MKRLALALALLAGAQPAFAQSTPTVIVGTEATGGYAGFLMNVLSPGNTNKRVLVQAYVPVGGGNIATGQVAVATTPTLVVAARPGRQKVIITSTAGTVFYVGGSTVSTTTGEYIAGTAGASITLDTGAAVYAVGSAALTVSYIEEY